MKLHILKFGLSKKRMKPIMIDELKKCENYKSAREKSKVKGWHIIEEAPPSSTVWKKRTCAVKGSGSKTNSGALIVGRGPSGYITKRGFQPNT